MSETNPLLLNIGDRIDILMVYPLSGIAWPIHSSDIPFLHFKNKPYTTTGRIFRIDIRYIEEIKITKDNTILTLGENCNNGAGEKDTRGKTPEKINISIDQLGRTAFTDADAAKHALDIYLTESMSLTTEAVYHFLTGKIRNKLDDIGYRMETTGDTIKDIMLNNPGKLSDGYHTFNELYDHRAALLVALTQMMPNFSWKSKLHHDGTMYDNMFIVGIDLPDGQISYHYDIVPWWHRFKCKELDRAPEWDGHESNDVIARLCNIPAYGYDWFSQPKEDK